jgi:RHS repeat-associated protein
MYDVACPHLFSVRKFTGKERDAESGLDNFGARYDSSSLGRFMSPDPLAGHTEDPQTLNRYVYVRNNPLNLTDPTGLDFYLSCQKASDRCGKDAAGNLVQGTTTMTTDANGNTTSTFNAGCPRFRCWEPGAWGGPFFSAPTPPPDRRDSHRHPNADFIRGKPGKTRGQTGRSP